MNYHFALIALSLAVTACNNPQTPASNPAFAHAFAPVKPQLSGNTFYDSRNLTDILKTDQINIEGLLNIPQLSAVTREMGPTVISIHTYPFKSPIAIASVKPWSSWWYPKQEDFMMGPLGKYDRIRKNRFEAKGEGKAPESAANFDRGPVGTKFLTWEGLCDAWSLASILVKEPRNPVIFKENGERFQFEISELKALLLLTYEAVDDSELQYYGQKFTGDDRGWVFPDIFPDQFHRFVEVQLFQQKTAFIMDHDPGTQVWNVPVYKANFIMDSIPGEPDSVFVRTWLYSAESVAPGEKEFIGTKEGVREYDYVLVGTRNSDGNLTVTSGYWVKGPTGVDSRNDHPDYLTRIPDPLKIVRRSSNPNIDIHLIDEILEKSY